MKRFILIVLGLSATLIMGAQESHIKEISIDTRATFHEQTQDGVYDSHFQGDFLNLHIKGNLSESLSFRVRQRLNKKIDEKNPFNATDFLWLRWQATPHLSFTAGKQSILVGGYEMDSAPIDVYYYGAFANRLYQYYAFGVTGTFTPVPGQDFCAEFCPSPISPGTQDAYSYNLYWNGHIGRIWRTTWSYNLVEDELHRKMNWIALGNKFLLGKLVVDIDFINRAAFQQPRFFFTDWSAILKAILTLGKWNLCTKVGFERNLAENVAPDGISYDLVLPAGNDYLYYGAGIEYFPLGNDNLRLHAAYFRDNFDRVNNFDIGITWRFLLYARP